MSPNKGMERERDRAAALQRVLRTAGECEQLFVCIDSDAQVAGVDAYSMNQPQTVREMLSDPWRLEDSKVVIEVLDGHRVH